MSSQKKSNNIVFKKISDWIKTSEQVFIVKKKKIWKKGDDELNWIY